MEGMKETPEGQAANRDLRKGTKRPESGSWPVAGKEAISAKKKEMAKKMRGPFSQEGSRKERVDRFTKHIDKGPKGFLTGHK